MELLSREHNDTDSHERVYVFVRFSPVRLRRRFIFAGTPRTDFICSCGRMPLSHYLAALMSGIGIGFTVAAPIGPMGMLCIQRTLASGMATGLATGFGAATVHLAYSAFAVLGLGSLAQPWVEANAVGFGIVSALTLLWFAIRTHRGSVVLQETGEVGGVRL